MNNGRGSNTNGTVYTGGSYKVFSYCTKIMLELVGAIYLFIHHPILLLICLLVDIILDQ